MRKHYTKLKAYYVIFRPVNKTLESLRINCIAKNKNEALTSLRASFEGLGHNPNWIQLGDVKLREGWKL